MGKVIPFQRREQTATRQAGASARVPVEVLLDEMRLNFEAEGVEPCPSFRIQAHLNSLWGCPSSQSIAFAEASFRGRSRAYLVDIANRTTEADWSARPGYFQALVNAIRSR
jgi:hypothetical protein